MNRLRVPSPFTLLLIAVSAGAVGLVVIPLVMALARSRDTFNSNSIRNLLDLPGLGPALLNTVILVVGSGALAMAIGTGLAWLNERTDARMGLATDVLPLVPFFVPPVAGAIGWVFLLAPRAGFLNVGLREVLSWVGVHTTEGPLNVHSWYGLIFVSSLYLVPYVYLVMSASLRNLDPSLEEASYVSGAGRARTLLRVMLPAAKPAFASAALLVLVVGFALYSVPVIIGTRAGIDVVSVLIVEQLVTSYPARTDLALILSALVLVVIGIAWVMQRRVTASSNHATVGGRGSRGHRAELGGWRWVARAAMLAYVLVAAVLPVAGLIIVSGQGFWSSTIDWSSLNLESYRIVLFDDETTRGALLRSVGLAITGGLIAILVAAAVSTYVSRTKGRFARIADGAVKLPAALSHIVLAIGFILALSGPPARLGGTATLLLIAYLVMYLPQASVASDSALSQVGPEMLEASAISGASEIRTFLRVQLPLMVGGLASGWALVFVLMVGDLTASRMLATTSNATIGFTLLSLWESGTFPRLAALAVTMTALTTIVITISVWLSRSRMKAVPYR